MKKLGFIILSLLVCLPVMTNARPKTNYRNALVYVYSPASNVMEDENIKLEIYAGSLWAVNKTPKTIFFDLSQCFGVHNGISYQLIPDDKKSSKKKKHQNITTEDEFISLPPSTGKETYTFIVNLSSGITAMEYTTSERTDNDFTEYDKRLLNLINEMVNESLEADPKGKDYIGTSYRHLTEDESVNNIGANIAYAFNKKAEDWTPLAISTWVSDIYFAPYYIEMPQELKKKDKRGFGVKETEAATIHIKAENPPFDFEEERPPIAVLDWTGSYKNGTFKLNHTRIAKKKGGMSFGMGLLIGGIFGGLASLLNNPDITNYKSLINFDGQYANWGNLKYMSSDDLTKFNNQ